MIQRFKNVTLLIIKYNNLQVVSFRLDTVLSPILQTGDDGCGDFWTIACYLFADSFFQLGDGLGIIFIPTFL